MEKFVKKGIEIYNGKLLEDLEDLETFGEISKNPNFSQKTFIANVNSEEIIHIKPKRPLLKPGTILRRVEGSVDDEDQMMCKAEDDDDGFLPYIDIGDIRNSEDLGERIRVVATVMVLGETIEIRKRSSVDLSYSGISNNGTSKAEDCNFYYTITHFIQALYGREKILIPTSIFSGDMSTTGSGTSKRHRRKRRRSVRRTSMMTDNVLDLKHIFRIYENAWTKDVLYPLEIAKDATET